MSELAKLVIHRGNRERDWEERDIPGGRRNYQLELRMGKFVLHSPWFFAMDEEIDAVEQECRRMLPDTCGDSESRYFDVFAVAGVRDIIRMLFYRGLYCLDAVDYFYVLALPGSALLIRFPLLTGMTPTDALVQSLREEKTRDAAARAQGVLVCFMGSPGRCLSMTEAAEMTGYLEENCIDKDASLLAQFFHRGVEDDQSVEKKSGQAWVTLLFLGIAEKGCSADKAGATPPIDIDASAPQEQVARADVRGGTAFRR